MKRIPELDGLRGIAILAVFLHHALHIKLLWMGVDIFFVLSGFLITGILLSFKGNSLRDYFGHFYDRRVRRIMPPYAVTLIIISLLTGLGWTRHWYLYLGGMNFIKPLGGYMPECLSPMWSLAVEEQFYLVWPFCVYFLSAKNLKRVAILLIVAAPILRGAVHTSNIWTIYMLTPFRMDLLSSGALLALIYRPNKMRFEKHGAPAGMALMVMGMASLLVQAHFGVTTYGNTRLSNVAVFESSLSIAIGTMIWALSGRLTAFFKAGPLRYVGRVSYTIYLTHLVTILLISQYTHMSDLSTALFSFVVVLLYATGSWFVLEKPVLGLKIPSRETVSVS
jgi:peptidoglycan/LPS O-acetylase OafA/YrhL